MLKPKLLYIDLFCGAGGTSTGVESAVINNKKLAKVIACVNHDANAIASHEANHPDALHYTEDIRTLDITELVKYSKKMLKKYPGSFLILWASLECTNFSKAKGGKARDADSRTLAEHLYRYIKELNPHYIQIENVEEFMSWGDLNENGKPISRDRGKLYLRWVKHIKKYGYDYDYRVLNSANFGAYTSRKRYFGQFAKHDLPIAWPLSSHSKDGGRGHRKLFASGKKWKAVKEVLDLKDEGISIFGRKKNLSDKTLERIFAGLIKFVAGGKDKFLSKYYSGDPNGKNISINAPAGTITTKDHHSLITSKFLSSYYGNGDNVSDIDNPAPTIRTKDSLALVTSNFIMDTKWFTNQSSNKSLEEPLSTIVASRRAVHYLVNSQFMDQQFGKSKPSDINSVVGAVTTNPKYNLVSCKQFIMDTAFNNVGSGLDEPSKVITANRKWHYLINPQFNSKGGDVNNPCFTLIAKMDKKPPYLVVTESGDVSIMVYETDSEITVRIKEFMALYGIIDIKMRMLKIIELLQIMGFPKNYSLFGTKAEQKKYIGNAVEVNIAKALCTAIGLKILEMKGN